MSRFRHRRLGFSAAFAGFLGAAVLGAWAPCASAQDAQRQLDDVVERLNALDTWLDDAGQRLAEQQKRLATADRAIASSTQRVRVLNGRIEGSGETLRELAANRDHLRKQRTVQAAQVANHLRHAWQYTDRDYLKTLLNQEEPARLERMVRYHGAMARARAGAITELRDTLQALAEDEHRVRTEQNSAQQAQRSLQDERAALLVERDRRRTVIASLRTDVVDKSRQREELEAARQRLQALIAELGRRQRAPSTGRGLGEGDLPWPVQGSVHRRFGQARAGGRMTWQGMVIQAPLGSDVRAVAAGQVVFADWLRGFGLLAIVDHGDDYMSLYGYADALYKRTGERVEGGETIAAAGRSGGQQDVGLYFEIREDGKPIDPAKWLQSRAR